MISPFLRPECLDWDFLARFYPGYETCPDIRCFLDMSACLDDRIDLVWHNRLINQESQQQFKSEWGEEQETVSVFDAYKGSGLTYYQVQTLFEDKLYAYAVKYGKPHFLQPSVYDWAEQILAARPDVLKHFYLSLSARA